MSQPGNKSGIAIILIVVALGAAAVATWFLWWQPRHARAEARSQVTAWEARWDEARACVLGTEPLAIDPGDALALAELQTGSTASNATRCTDVIGAITRPEGAASSDAVERAFAEVEAAIPAVAKAYAFRISAPDDEINRRVADLGVAISALDGAHDRLRAAAGLPPRERKAGQPLRRLAEPTALVADGVPLTASMVRAAGGALRGDRYSGAVKETFFATAPDQVHRQHWAAEAIASVPGATWMVAALPGRAFDEQAKDDAIAVAAMPTADAVDFAVAKLVVPVGAWVPVAALGDGDARTVVLVPAVEPESVPNGIAAFQLATSKDGGKTWDVQDGRVLGQVNTVMPDPVSGSVLVYSENEMPQLDIITAPGQPENDISPTLSDVPDLANLCRHGVHVAYMDYNMVYLDSVEVKVPDADQTLRVADCTDTAALVEEGSMPVRYRRCTQAGCQEIFHGATYAFGRPAMRDDGTVYYAAGRGALLALWTEGVAAPTYFKLPRPMTLDEIVVWGGAPYALLYDAHDPEQKLFAVKLA